jgi:hypothetical protein
MQRKKPEKLSKPPIRGSPSLDPKLKNAKRTAGKATHRITDRYGDQKRPIRANIWENFQRPLDRDPHPCPVSGSDRHLTL